MGYIKRTFYCLLIIFGGNLAQAEQYIIGAQNIEYFPHYDFTSKVDKGVGWAILEAFSDASGHEFVYLDMPVRRLQIELNKGNVDFVYPDNPRWNSADTTIDQKTFSKPNLFFLFKYQIIVYKCMSKTVVKTSKDTHKSAAKLGTP